MMSFDHDVSCQDQGQGLKYGNIENTYLNTFLFHFTFCISYGKSLENSCKSHENVLRTLRFCLEFRHKCQRNNNR